MPLLENYYKAATKIGLELNIRKLEAGNQIGQTQAEYQLNASIVQDKIISAQQMNLISQEQAEAMKKRVEIVIQNNQFMRNESEERIDDIENPRERAKRYFNMDDINAEISQEKAQAETSHGSGKIQRQTHSSPSIDERAKE